MFEIKTYLELESYDYSDPYYMENPSAKYIEIDDLSNIRKIVDHRKFTPEHIQQLITIKYNEMVVVGFEVPSGLSLWESTFIHAIEDYLHVGKVEMMYSIDLEILTLESINNNQMKFSIFHEWDSELVYASAILPEKEFIESMLTEANHYFQKLIDYKIFEEKRLDENTPRDYPQQMIKIVEELRRKINNV
ncbi:hypothetical protein [Robertmurraya sp.]|uniref:hypothetical protein n=1 Tax=Robertmurraya sp. TaxID=2837525 RepID=UPI003704112B